MAGLGPARRAYDAAHGDARNRRVHAVAVPMEVVATHALVLALSGGWRGWTQGTMVVYQGLSAAWALATTAELKTWRQRTAAALAAVFHASVPRLAAGWSVGLAALALVVAWGIQVGVGHVLFEGKAPSMVTEKNGFSVASIALSVVLAWLPPLSAR